MNEIKAGRAFITLRSLEERQQELDEKYATKIRDISAKSGCDRASAHIATDELLVVLLLNAGYTKTAEAYEQEMNTFWYE